jgi:hypothetical protein
VITGVEEAIVADALAGIPFTISMFGDPYAILSILNGHRSVKASCRIQFFDCVPTSLNGAVLVTVDCTVEIVVFHCVAVGSVRESEEAPAESSGENSTASGIIVESGAAPMRAELFQMDTLRAHSLG